MHTFLLPKASQLSLSSWTEVSLPLCAAAVQPQWAPPTDQIKAEGQESLNAAPHLACVSSRLRTELTHSHGFVSPRTRVSVQSRKFDRMMLPTVFYPRPASLFQFLPLLPLLCASSPPSPSCHPPLSLYPSLSVTAFQGVWQQMAHTDAQAHPWYAGKAARDKIYEPFHFTNNSHSFHSQGETVANLEWNQTGGLQTEGDGCPCAILWLGYMRPEQPTHATVCEHRDRLMHHGRDHKNTTCFLMIRLRKEYYICLHSGKTYNMFV